MHASLFNESIKWNIKTTLLYSHTDDIILRHWYCNTPGMYIWRCHIYKLNLSNALKIQNISYIIFITNYMSEINLQKIWTVTYIIIMCRRLKFQILKQFFLQFDSVKHSNFIQANFNLCAHCQLHKFKSLDEPRNFFFFFFFS
jgi:hypothetical protein